MQFLLAVAIWMLAAVPTLSLGAPVRSESVLVRAVIDGDTIDVATIGRVRLLGIDAPEIGRGFDTTAPFGYEARERLRSLVLRRWVRLEGDGAPLDAYNRHLAYVLREDGLFVNAALVRDGLARVTARVPLVRLGELRRAEEEAQAFRRGMWGHTPQIPTPSYTERSAGRGGSTPRAKASKASRMPKMSKPPRHPRQKTRGSNSRRVRVRT